MSDVREINVETGEETARPYTQAELNAIAEAANVPPPVPQTVTRAQGRIWLHRAGLLASVTAAINASPDVELQIWWADAQTWRRDNPYIAALAAQFSIDLDAAFREAALIEA